MSLTRTINVVLPDVLADDIEYYTEESGLYLDSGEFVRDAVRSMLNDVVAGFKADLDDAASGYMMVRESNPETRQFLFMVPEQMAVDIERFVFPLGYDMNRFVGISALRNIDRVALFMDDVDERIGNLDTE